VQLPVFPSLITTPDIGDDYLDADAYNEHSKYSTHLQRKLFATG